MARQMQALIHGGQQQRKGAADQRTQGNPYRSPLPAERKHPLGTPPELLAKMERS